MKRNFITKLDSYALLIIALSAVIVSIWQANQQQRHDRLSMKPYLDWPSEYAGDTRVVKLWNKGTGVALITDVVFTINDSTFSSWEIGLKYADSTIRVNQSKLFSNYKLAPNETITLVSYERGTGADGSLSISIEFESVYGEKDRVSYSAGL